MRNLLLIVTLTALPAVLVCDGVSLPATWTTELAQHNDDTNKRGGIQLPCRRYSHAAVIVGNEMIITHGYYFDHTGGGGATWLDDTWAFRLPGPNGSVLEVGITDSIGQHETRWRKIPAVVTNGEGPCARMMHSVVQYEQKLFLFGGDDGGHRRSESSLNDLWELDLTAPRWTKVIPRGMDESQHPTTPSPRASHSAIVIGNKMIVFAGIHLDDVWAFDFKSHVWSVLHAGGGPEDFSNNPGKRHGHAMAPDPGGAGFYIFGGFAFKDDLPLSRQASGDWGPQQDLWHFELHTGTWQRLHLLFPEGGRAHATLHLTGTASGESSLIMFGGAACNPGCRCFGDLWSYSLVHGKWHSIQVQKEPITRYKHTTVLCSNRLYTFGGESYKPYMYHNSVQSVFLDPHRTNTMQNLEL